MPDLRPWAQNGRRQLKDVAMDDVFAGIGYRLDQAETFLNFVKANFDVKVPWRLPCIVAAGGPITLATPGATIDSTTMTNPMRVMVDAQADNKENGVYIWTGAAVPLTRAPDVATGESLWQSHFPIAQGTRAGQVMFNSNATVPVLGSDALTFASMSDGGVALHATTHQHGGTDEVATATPGPDVIPKTLPDGRLVCGFIPWNENILIDQNQYTTTAIIPTDNTIPQSTEGGPAFAGGITPQYSNSYLRIDVVAYVSASVDCEVIVTLFRPPAADAIAVASAYVLAGKHTMICFSAYQPAVATTFAEFDLRFGPSVAATAGLNVVGEASQFGSLEASSIAVTELFALGGV